MSKLPIRFRAASEEDIGFIFNSWLKSFRHSYFAKVISNTIYYEEQHKILEALIKASKVIVACDEKDTSQIYGYAVGDEIDNFLIIHYVYVKHSFRNMGIGKALLNVFDHSPEKAAIYTMHTRTCERLAPKYNFVYHPYIIFSHYDIKEVREFEREEEKED
jgi:GNAT superfamily N-acetyltransferase